VATGFAAVWETWEEFRFQESEVRDLGDSVLWLGRVKMKGGASHVELDQEFAIHAVLRNRKARPCARFSRGRRPWRPRAAGVAPVDERQRSAVALPDGCHSRKATAGGARPARRYDRGMADSDDPPRNPDVPPPPKLPDVDSPPPQDVLDAVPPKEELVQRARSADEIVEEQPSVEELLNRDR
jgi:hypothetical protein